MSGRTPRRALGGLCPPRPPARPVRRPRPPTGGQPRSGAAGTSSFPVYCLGAGSALALLVARVVADDHDPAVAADDPAFVADLLDARLDLHGVPFSPAERAARRGGPTIPWP